MKEKLKELGQRAESGLRRLCGKMHPERRLAFVIGMTAIIAICSVWMMISALYQIYWQDVDTLDFKHIENVLQPLSAPADSLTVNPEIPADYGTE